MSKEDRISKLEDKLFGKKLYFMGCVPYSMSAGIVGDIKNCEIKAKHIEERLQMLIDFLNVEEKITPHKKEFIKKPR